jgi:hypothetical protein
VPGLSLTASLGGTDNRSGLVFNPVAELYYSVNSGNSSYPCDYYDNTGTYINSIAQGFDYRGAWWNPSTAQFEGNGFGSLGLFVHTLAAGTGYPTGTGTVIFTGNLPEIQSAGDLDYDANEIVYYYDGFIHRYNRTNNAFLGQYAINGLPVAFTEINTNTAIYTGCLGYEIGIYDFTNRRLLFIDKATGDYAGFSQMPGSAPQRDYNGMSYTNGLFWLYDSGIWFSYQVVEPEEPSGIEASDRWMQDIRIAPNPATDQTRLSMGERLGEVALTLVDLQGRAYELLQTEAGPVFDLDLSPYPAGMYFLRIQSGETIATRRLLIQ